MPILFIVRLDIEGSETILTCFYLPSQLEEFIKFKTFPEDFPKVYLSYNIQMCGFLTFRI